ncbi:hypothetical protein HZB07_03940 [Candidatus Saganbacteria bacterium]|nr:hypothetical protein [Candidatus Saganbacteria bacterium]
MAKVISDKKFIIKLPVIDIEKAYKLKKPVVVIPEEEYMALLENLQDLRSALRAEEEYLTTGGKLFSEYDKQRRVKK